MSEGLHMRSAAEGFDLTKDGFLNTFKDGSSDALKNREDSEQDSCPWGEYEIDYILFSQCKILRHNPS